MFHVIPAIDTIMIATSTQASGTAPTRATTARVVSDGTGLLGVGRNGKRQLNGAAGVRQPDDLERP
ncbi:hypothetical protein GCM10027265_40620 [Jatrophihabitans fulvus]